MLVPRAPSAFVCLRCEAQLARRSLPRFAQQRSHVQFSSSARHGGGDDGDARDALTQLEPRPLKIIKERELLDRVRRRKGKTIRETSARLGGIKTLGDDAEILLLKELADPEDLAGKEAAAMLHKKMTPLEVPDIAASLQEESKVLSPHEIHRQIENLRPKIHGDPQDEQHVSQATFAKLMKILTTGFTYPQLSAFYSIAKNVERRKVYQKVIDGLKGDKGTTKRPVVRSEWQPGTTNIQRRLPGVDVTLRPPKQPVSKQLLVDSILRDCWKLVLLEEMEAPGEIELSLQPWQITLLNVGESDTFLGKIGQKRRAKLEIHREHGVLRITADKTTAEYAADDVEDALNKAQSKHLNLRPWLPLLVKGKTPKPKHLTSMFTQSDLDTVSALTHTCIEPVQGAILWIRGFDGSAVEEAERLLIRLLPLKDQSLHSIDSQSVDVAKDSNILMPVFLPEISLGQKDRKTDFGRHSMPISKLAMSETAEDSEQQYEEVTKPANTSEAYTAHVALVVAAMHRSSADTAAPSQTLGSWPSRPEYAMNAELGQALFPLNPTPPTQNPSPATPAITRPLTFNPFIPGLTGLLTSPYFTAIDRTGTPSLFYDFVPSPVQPSFKSGQLFPDLIIQIRTGRQGSDPYIHALNLSFDKRVHNVLLPGKPADIRFRSAARLKMENITSVEAVNKWVEMVVQNIKQEGKLWAPTLTLEVPAWTIPGAAKDAQDLKPVTYLFNGIRFRQSVQGIAGETMLSYRTTQSGKLDAKSGVLSAHYEGGGDLLLRNQSKIREFAEAAFALVDSVGEGVGATVPVSKQLNPRAVVSARKIRRAQVQARKRARREAGEFGEEGEKGGTEGEGDVVGLEKPWEPLEEDKGGERGDATVDAEARVQQEEREMRNDSPTTGSS